SSVTVSGSTEGSDTLSGIEKIQFADKVIDASTLEEFSDTTTPTTPTIPKPTTKSEVVTTPKESDGINYFLLQLSKPLSTDVTISYTTKDGTAQAGTVETGGDYVKTSGTATINKGELTVVIEVTLLDDSVTESDETFELVLSNPVGISFPEGKSEISVTRTIIDDDSSASSSANMIDLIGVAYTDNSYG
ncbi:MAG: hypothetical protein HQL46_16335, partial [Gammaproteobacteria bacterium]|nr:hypothetical protein [Gammaproteobacteria bacterium]